MQPSRRRTALFAAFALCGRLAVGAAVPEIAPLRVLPVEGPEHFQPSGLALAQGRLFAVSDKHSDAIFRLELRDDRAVAVVDRPIRLPEGDAFLDLEGIAADGADGFHVVSEEMRRVAFVPRDGRASWVCDDLRPGGRSLGLLVKHNAAFEGLALLGRGHFLLAAERDARGVIEVELSGTPPRIAATRIDTSSVPHPAGRKPDLTDLGVWRGRVFALLRNACAVVELVRGPEAGGAWREGETAATFTGIERDPRTMYRNTTYGLAEGLAIDDDHLFIVLDNNEDALAADPRDRRPRLLVFANPFAGTSPVR